MKKKTSKFKKKNTKTNIKDLIKQFEAPEETSAERKKEALKGIKG